MSYHEDWRNRHGPRSSGSRVIIYLILLAVILLLMSRAGEFSRVFTGIFLSPQGETVETE
ncbi:MAG TPA: hypothetical protein PLM22_06790 [Candidatus Sabulitectum sp.]|nr:hypothetical protein [Candidatus Sabulitectum sp.]HPF32407.1 hypothetical protein [Candidatus Sabulitectum sp.]HPJ28625.1 hypothetical protein [Candidatus Sabulitectum sp.]HPR23294.1 hypothetical protein [Candidatus Sabulitectum sp.]